MPLFWWIIFGVIFSYIISCVRDFGPFRKEWQNLPKAILYAWYQATISIIFRAMFIYIFLYSSSKIVVKLFPKVSGGINNFIIMLIVTLITSALITLPPKVIGDAFKKQSVEKLKKTIWIKIIVIIDRLVWPKVISELEFIRAEEINKIWRDEENKWSVFQLYEEKKDVLVKYHFRNRLGFPKDTWLYLGLLAGNNNSKRAEALIHLYGTRWLKKNVKALRVGERTSTIPVKTDSRKWSNSTCEVKIEEGINRNKRKCDSLLYELYNQIKDE